MAGAIEIVPDILGGRVDEFMSAATSGRPFEDLFDVRRPDGTVVPVAAAVAAITGDDGGIARLIVIATDISGERKHAHDRFVLTQAVDQAQEGILVTDTDGTIQYANPAVERLSGFRREDLVGKNPRIWRSGIQDSALYSAMWTTLLAGLPWKGQLVNRRRDGELYEVDATISPVRDPGGSTVAYVGVQRDLSVERSLEAGLESEIRDRALVHDLAARIRQGPDPEATATSVAHVVASLDDVEAVIVYHLHRVGSAVVPLAAVTPAWLPVAIGEPIEPALAVYLRDRIVEGTTGAIRLDEGRLGLRTRMPGAAGLAAVASPILDGGLPAGAIIAIGRPVDSTAWVSRRQRALAEVATHIAPLLLPQLADREDVASARARLEGILTGRAYRPVFQPVLDLASRRVAGFEALTRFADGIRPDIRFGEAAAVGLGLELELACASAAMEAAESLDSGAWLSINVSPATILSGRLADVLAEVDRPLVIEITEHVEIGDYDALRVAVSALGPRVLLSVDDAGAGYASLRHVLELRPHFVKLDRGLINGVDRDPVRQALVAGMVHYARQARSTLVAEGIETEAEARVLAQLGVELGQGFLLGVPAPPGQPGSRTRRTPRRVDAAPDDPSQPPGGAGPGESG